MRSSFSGSNISPYHHFRIPKSVSRICRYRIQATHFSASAGCKGLARGLRNATPSIQIHRISPDVTPVGTTQAEEIARISALGATPVDVGQVDASWVVLADPEGNEVCVMSEWIED